MKKAIVSARLAVFMVLALVCSAPLPSAAEDVAGEELVFLTWPSYIDMDIVADFERKFNAKVRFVYFESDDARHEMLANSNGTGFDLILSDGISLTSYVNLGWIDAVPTSEVPNLQHLDMHWRKAYPQGDTHGVPYAWGTMGIAYRRDLVPGPLTTWLDLLRPAPALHGKIIMIRSARDVIGVALKALGHSENSADPGELAEARELILGQKPYVRAYSYVALTPESELVTGAAAAAMVFSGDALALQQLNPNIEFVLPAEGSNVCVDYLAITKASEKKQLTAAFINFIHEPQNSARLATTIQYATPSLAAKPFLSSEFLLNEVIHPPAAKLARSEYFAILPPEALKIRNELFQQVLQ